MLSIDNTEYQISQSFADYFEMMNVSGEDMLSQNREDSDIPVRTYANYTDEWGPHRDPLYIVIPITIMYVIIFITGVIGNISTCVVISRNKSMHTATNYYLFSLAVSDLLLLVSGLPPEMYFIWSKYPYIFGEAFCVIQGFAAETSANATVLTITAFTVERYVAICHPFLSHTMSKLSRAIKFVMAIWMLALCLAIPQALSFGIVYQEMEDGSIINNDHYVCTVKRELVPHAFELSTLVFFVAPMSLISILYVLIALQLRRSKLVRRGSKGKSIELKHRMPKSSIARSSIVQTMVMSTEGADLIGGGRGGHTEKNGLTTVTPTPTEDGRKNYHRNMHNKATKHVVNMLIAVVVAFFICWAPFHAQRLLAIHGNSIITPDIIALYTILTYISGVLYYLSTCINPLLYNIMSNKFRNAFRETLSRYFPVGTRARKPARRYSTLSIPRSISPTRSQSLSHSGGTSRQASLRYLDGDMSRRPLVVSFRKPNASNPVTCIHAAHCGCTRNNDVRRAIYTNRTDHQIEENGIHQSNGDSVLKFSLKPHKTKKLKKWGRKRRDANLYGSNDRSYKIVCSECNRYLGNDINSEKEKKVVLIGGSTIISESSCAISENYNSSSEVSKEHKQSPIESMNLNEEIPTETDLIPRHMCPNQFFNDQEKHLSSNGSIYPCNRYSMKLDRFKKIKDDVQHSTTMPDIVDYVLRVKDANEQNGKVQNGLNQKLLALNTILFIDREKNTQCDTKQRGQSDLKCMRRKWGSADAIFTK